MAQNASEAAAGAAVCTTGEREVDCICFRCSCRMLRALLATVLRLLPVSPSTLYAPFPQAAAPIPAIHRW